MMPTLRNCYRAIAYMHFHPKEKKKAELLEKLLKDAWYLGYPRSYFDKPNKDIDVEDMSDWELEYVFL